MFDININGLEEVGNALDKLELATNTQDVLDASGAFMLHRIKERFLRQEATDGTTWKESYAAQWRKAKGKGGGTLFDTGTLFHSIILGRAGINERRIFTNVDYARKHQYGLEGEERRNFLGFNSEDELGVVRLINARVRDALL